jgi:hypothetical protein
MPLRDGTGPSGSGRLTGRGLGPCGANSNNSRAGGSLLFWLIRRLFGNGRGLNRGNLTGRDRNFNQRKRG